MVFGSMVMEEVEKFCALAAPRRVVAARRRVE